MADLPVDVLEGGPTALLALMVMMIFVGWLVPRWYVRRIERDLATERETNRVHQQTIAALTAQLQQTLEIGRTAGRALESLPRPAGEVTRAGVAEPSEAGTEAR